MRRYFFDVNDRGRRVRDIVGLELEDDLSAMREANLITYHLIQVAEFDPRRGTILVSVRTEDGTCACEASTSLAGN
jgi:hypothetical protein